MCTGGVKAPKAAPIQEPLHNVQTKMSDASSDAARQQAMRRGLASVWTRYGKSGSQAVMPEKLGG